LEELACVRKNRLGNNQKPTHKKPRIIGPDKADRRKPPGEGEKPSKGAGRGGHMPALGGNCKLRSSGGGVFGVNPRFWKKGAQPVHGRSPPGKRVWPT